MREVEILLATYNAGAFLPELFRSLHAQTHRHWRASIRDNGSSDGTVGIVEAEVSAYPDRFSILGNSEAANIGPCQSFARLLSKSSAQYVMFCDADDVWLPHKIALVLGEMQRLEALHGPETPVLVHTDVAVVDASLRPISPSFWKHNGIDPYETNLARLVIRHGTIGNTFIMNRSLVDLTLPVPQEAVMHDWWVVLVAAAFGKIGTLPETTLLYRQHGNNDTGAQKLTVTRLARRALDAARLRQRLAMKQLQAAAFVQRFGAKLKLRERSALQHFADLSTRSFLTRRYVLLRHGLLDDGVMRTLGMLVYV